MKKKTGIFNVLTVACFAVLGLAQGAWADNAETIKNYINSTANPSLTASVSNNSVIVKGTLSATPSGANFLTLNIDASVTVIWQASLAGTPSSDYSLINISGGSGTFNMSSGSIENNGTGRAITNNSAGAVSVSSGTVRSGSGYTIYNASTGTVTVSGGTVEKTGTSSSNYAIYNYNSTYNSPTGTVTVSGGTVTTGGGFGIYNDVSTGGGGTVSISNATVNFIYNNGGNITVSSGTTMHQIYNASGTANISGGTIGSTTRTSRAIYNAGTMTISNSARISSATTESLSGTIYHNSGTLNITGGTVENTATTGTNGNAIYSHYNSGTINISGGTVNSANGHAINSYNGSSKIINISGGTVSTSGSGKSALYNDFSGTVKITGGTISATSSGYAVNNNSSIMLTLGNSPTITGRIYSYPDKLSVITSAPDIFNPGSKIYTLDFPANQYEVAKIAVMNGRAFLNNFELCNKDRALTTLDAGLHLAIAAAVKVIFNPNGGTPTNWRDTVSMLPGQTIPAAKNPLSRLASNYFSRSSYINGNKWSTNPSGTPEFIFENGSTSGTPVNSNPTTLYLKWIPIFTITFNANGGSVSTTAGTTKADSTLSLTSLPTPTRTGYTFSGWFTATTGGTQIELTRKYSANTTIHARWTPITYTIAYTLNNGTFPGGSNPNPASYTYESNFITFQDPSRDGYFFDGWYENPSFSGNPVTSIPKGSSTGDKTYYAKWSPIYTVTFDANGGSVSPASATTASGCKLAFLRTPTRSDGYYFTGWFTAATGGTQVTTNTVFTGNATIHAQWTQNHYTVSFNLNGGTGTVPTNISNVLHGSILTEEQKPSAAGLTRSGYVNDGKWYTNASGTTEFVFGAGGTPVTNTITLYLKWLPIYTVSLDPNFAGTVFSEGFEGANSFSTDATETIISEDFEGINSFTIVNGSGNRWYVGTDTKYDGTMAAYIATSSGTTNSYSHSATSVHMYRDVTFPASNNPYTLSFYWKGMGENNYDDLKVYLVETSSPITAGSTPSGTLLGTYRGYNTWQQATVSIPASNAGTTKRLVFAWRNDGSAGIQPPIAIDNIVVRSSMSPNRWYVGTDTKYGGSNSAYIAASGDTTNSYNNTSSVARIYRNVSFPAYSSDFVLSFYWKGMGENNYDDLKVYLVGTLSSIEITPSSGLLGTYQGASSWQQATISIPASNAGTTKVLVFTWRNNDSGDTNPPIAIDNIVLTGGYAPLLAVINVMEGDALSTSQIPPAREFTRDGYVNDGKWYTDAAGTTEFVSGTTVDGNTTLYLKWSPVYHTYAVNFNLSGGSGTVPSPVYVASDNTIFSEDFENANSFTVVNGSANQWHIGTDTKYGGSKSAYIAASGGTTNSYNVNSPSIVHMYRNVALRASLEPCTLSFNWKGMGEADYDYLSVHLVETSVTPTAGTEISSGLLGIYYGKTDDWQLATIIIPESNNGATKRFVFTWRNDNEFGTQPPIALDNIVLKEGGYGSGGIAITTPPPTEDFAKTGNYIENKWYTRTGTEEDGYAYNEFVFGENGTPVRDNLTLYLKWLPQYKVSFDLNGGSGTVPGNIYIMPPGSDSLTVAQKPSTNFNRTGYFLHENDQGKWYTRTGTEEGGYEYDEFIFGENGTPVTSDVTLYLMWTPQYKVSFDLNGGSGTVPGNIYIMPPGSDSLTVAQKPSTGGFTRIGYFLRDEDQGKWYTRTGTEEGGYEYDEFIFGENGTPVTGDVTLYLKWTLLHYKVSFDSDGGSSSVNYTVFSENFEGSTRLFTSVNGSQTNKWAVGAATANGGSKSAYISNDGGTSNAYRTSTVSVAHLYHTVTFPVVPSPYTLSFDWKGMGESDYDDLKVHLVETSSPITAGSTPSGTLLETYQGANSWQTDSIKIPASNSGTTKQLVFTWRNNDESGVQPPIAVDNIVLTATEATVSIATDVLPGSTLAMAQKPSAEDITKTGYVNDGKWYTVSGIEYTEFVFGESGTPINDNVTLYLKWTINTYTVTFVDRDGTVLSTQTVDHGSAATEPAEPTNAGYTFTSWDKEFDEVTGNLTVTALYDINTYTITYDLDGGTVSPTNPVNRVSYTAETPDFTLRNPTKTGYTFAGWTGTNGTTPQTTVSVSLGSTGDRNYVANWALKVTFVDHDGTELSVQMVEHGGAATEPTEPTREGYVFTNWDVAFDNVTSDLIVTAVYEINTYTVTFVDHDGTELSVQMVEHGGAATAPAEPTNAGYTFISWDKAFDEVTGNLTVTAVYEINTYTVTFVDHDGTELSVQTVGHGGAATAPAEPTREGYTFTNWDVAFDNVTSDLTVTAVYEESVPILPHKIANSNMLTPTRNGITLTAKTNATIEVYNLSGKLISRQEYLAGNYSISFGHLPKGMYIAKASFGSEKQILRVMLR